MGVAMGLHSEGLRQDSGVLTQFGSIDTLRLSSGLGFELM
jgi:hypothetical protein